MKWAYVGPIDGYHHTCHSYDMHTSHPHTQAYLRQAQSEVAMLRLLNERHDPHDRKHIVRCVLPSLSPPSLSIYTYICMNTPLSVLHVCPS